MTEHVPYRQLYGAPPYVPSTPPPRRVRLRSRTIADRAGYSAATGEERHSRTVTLEFELVKPGMHPTLKVSRYGCDEPWTLHDLVGQWTPDDLAQLVDATRRYDAGVPAPTLAGQWSS